MVHIKVTQDDIERGYPKSCAFCPIALAGQRAFGDSFIVEVGTTMLDVYSNASVGKGVDYALPLATSDFIAFFDAGLPVEPIEFEMEEA